MHVCTYVLISSHTCISYIQLDATASDAGYYVSITIYTSHTGTNSGTGILIHTYIIITVGLL